MPKMKTNKAAAKKVHVSGGKKKKLLRRATGQNHYNSRETGSVIRAKRNDARLSKKDEKNMRRALPYL